MPYFFWIAIYVVAIVNIAQAMTVVKAMTVVIATVKQWKKYKSHWKY